MADQFLLNLYDGEGQYIGDVLTDIDMLLATNRDYVIEDSGKVYKWEQRRAQWREVDGVISLSIPPGFQLPLG